MHFIYKISNNINQKIYIGQTNNPNLRWSQHKSSAKYSRGRQIITKAMAKYHIDNFHFEIIATCLDQEAADQAEENIIEQFQSRNPLNGYNISAGGNSTPRTPEIQKKITESLKKHYQSHPGWLKEKKLPKEWKENISKASLGKIGTNLGKKFSDEHRKRISGSLTGRVLSEEHKKKLSESHQGQIPVNRKLTFEQAEQIRREYESGSYTQKQLGLKYGLSQDCIFNIVHRYTYHSEV